VSLIDALLLEEPAPPKAPNPREIFISLRADGARGSGTASDAYCGGTGLTPPVSGTLEWDDGSEELFLWWLVDETIALLESDDEPETFTSWVTVQTSAPHEFITHDVVNITGITGPVADHFNGTFIVRVLTATSFQYRIVSPPRFCSPEGIAQCRRVIYRFDELMHAAPARAVIRLGPGVFETRGYPRTNYVPGRIGWAIKPGQRIIGSGMNRTILRIVHATDNEYHGIGDDSAAIQDGFEASDLTIDSALRLQPYDAVVKGALVAHGTHIRLRRLHTYDFGTHLHGYECFPISSGGAGSVDARIEGCVAEHSSPTGVYVNTIFGVQSGESTNGIPRYCRAGIVRDCYVDGDHADERAVAIRSLSFSNGVATVTTVQPHRRSTGEWVVISGVLEAGVLSTHYNGSFQVRDVTDDTFEFTPDGTPTESNPGGQMFVGRYPGRYIPVQRLERDAEHPTVAILTSYGPHYRVPGEMVSVHLGQDAAVSPEYLGWRRVLAVLSPTRLKYQMPGIPANTVINEGIRKFMGGGGNQAIGAQGMAAGVCHGNRFFSVGTGVYYDTFGGKDVAVRQNYFSNVDVGAGVVFQGGNPSSGYLKPAKQLDSAMEILNSTTVAFFTQRPHNLHTGDTVYVRGVLGVNGGYGNIFNIKVETNQYQLLTVLSDFAFTYKVGDGANNNGLQPQGSPVVEKTIGEKVKTGSSLVKEGSKAVFTTLRPHGLLPLQLVEIRGALAGGTYANNYNRGPNNKVAVTPLTGSDHAFEYDVSGVSNEASGSPVFSTEQTATALTGAGTVATFTCAQPHGLFSGQIVQITGAVPVDFNGTFRIAVLDAYKFTFEKETGFPAAATTLPPFTVFLVIESIVRSDSAGRTGGADAGPIVFARVTAVDKHSIKAGDTVSLWDVKVGGSLENPYNGAFRVERVQLPDDKIPDDILSDRMFIITPLYPADANADANTGQWASQNSTPLLRTTWTVGTRTVVGAIFTTDKPGSGNLFAVDSPRRPLVTLFGACVNGSFVNPYNGVVEVDTAYGNDWTPRRCRLILFDPATGGPGDPGAHGSASPLAALAEATPLHVEGTKAIYHTVLEHGLEIGHVVRINDVMGKSTPPFTGVFRITAIPSPTSFEWEFETPPGLGGFPGCTYYPFWRVIRFAIERNTMELAPPAYPAQTPNFRSLGVFFLGDVRRLLVDENVFRVLPGVDLPSAAATTTQKIEHLLVQNNIAENLTETRIGPDDLKSFGDNATVHVSNYVSNIKGDGTPLPGYEDTVGPLVRTGIKRRDFDDRQQDALWAAI